MTGKKRLLITGGTGYVGSSLFEVLKKDKTFDIAVIVRDKKNAYSKLGKDVYLIDASESTFKREVKNFNPHIAIHLAAYSTSSDRLDDIVKLVDSNILFTSILLDALIDCDLELFINTGSFSEFHFNNEVYSPTYFYSATKTSVKIIIDYYQKIKSFKVVNANLFTVYGKFSNIKKIIDYAIESLDSDAPVKMSEGLQELDFIHIDDVISFYINLIKNYNSLEINYSNYFIGTGVCTSIRSMVKILEKITGKNANINWGAYSARKVDTVKAVANLIPVKNDFNWSPKINLEDGLRKYIGVNNE